MNYISAKSFYGMNHCKRLISLQSCVFSKLIDLCNVVHEEIDYLMCYFAIIFLQNVDQSDILMIDMHLFIAVNKWKHFVLC